MRFCVRLLVLAALLIGVAVTGCGGPKQAPRLEPKVVAVVAPPAPAPPAPVPVPAPDPVQLLISRSQQHFDNGQRELGLGHLQQARTEFDRALDVLLESPLGARVEPRIREHFDKLVDRISAYELSTLAKGDGFTEKMSEPASIDELLTFSTFDDAPKPDLEQAIKSDLEHTEHDVPIPLNDKVLRYVDLFQGRLRDFLAEGLQRGSKYLPMIQNVFRAEGLPLDLAYVPLVESAFKTNALSRAKARGMWQFMRATALENGLKQDWYIDERSDPEKATVAAAKYLQTLADIFGGDWHLALASYNGGPGRVQRAMKGTATADFWSLAARSRLPRETREYVPMILAAIVIARNPVQYGFDLQPESQATYEKVSLSSAVDLRRVAEWTGASIDDIQALNPELRRWTTPLRYPGYELKVPAGTAESVKEGLAQTHDAERAALNWHTVKKGESLVTISRKLNVRAADLAEANYLTTKSRVRPGQKLIVPREPTTLLAARTDRAVPVSQPRVADARDAVPASAMVSAAPTRQSSETNRLVYRVKRGDTLTSIAQLFNTTVSALKSWNARVKGTRIGVGDRLVIFATQLPAGTR